MFLFEPESWNETRVLKCSMECNGSISFQAIIYFKGWLESILNIYSQLNGVVPLGLRSRCLVSSFKQPPRTSGLALSGLDRPLGIHPSWRGPASWASSSWHHSFYIYCVAISDGIYFYCWLFYVFLVLF